MTVGFKFTCMLSCTFILIEYHRKSTFQLTKYLLKNTTEGQLHYKSQNIGLDLDTFFQKIMSYI